MSLRDVVFGTGLIQLDNDCLLIDELVSNFFIQKSVVSSYLFDFYFFWKKHSIRTTKERHIPLSCIP
jgi:hypothetical protein